MSRQDTALAILQEFGAGIGLEDIAFDAANTMALDFGDLPVTLTYADTPLEAIWIAADLGAVVPDNLAALQFLLEINMRAWMQNVMTISLAEDGHKAVGATVLPVAALSTAQLNAVLEPFIQNGLTVRRELARSEYQIEDNADGGGTDSLPQNFMRV